MVELQQLDVRIEQMIEADFIAPLRQVRSNSNAISYVWRCYYANCICMCAFVVVVVVVGTVVVVIIVIAVLVVVFVKSKALCKRLIMR